MRMEMKHSCSKKPFSPLRLLRIAIRAAGKAHAPYSKYQVGAALRSSDGRIFTGCNVENASYGLTICAERAAVFSAVADGCRQFSALAIVASGETPPYPCGACRQVLAEFCGADFPVYVAPASAPEKFTRLTLGQLLPCTFRLSS
jgi:cytidine deaminase